MLLKCENVSLEYDGRTVLDGLNFFLEGGEYLCVLGENGSGKSTLVKALLGLKSPSGGRIVYGDGLKNTDIGYLPQQTTAQKDFPATVSEIVLSGCREGGLGFLYTKAQKKTALENMEKLGIADIAGESYRQLSGGQQQRVLLARALCATKRLLLLDEPVTGLDPMATHDLYEIIRNINSNDGITVIAVSHDIKCSVEQASHILHLRNRQLFFGTAHQYMHSDTGKYYIGEECPECLKH